MTDETAEKPSIFQPVRRWWGFYSWLCTLLSLPAAIVTLSPSILPDENPIRQAVSGFYRAAGNYWFLTDRDRYMVRTEVVPFGEEFAVELEEPRLLGIDDRISLVAVSYDKGSGGRDPYVYFRVYGNGRSEFLYQGGTRKLGETGWGLNFRDAEEVNGKQIIHFALDPYMAGK